MISDIFCAVTWCITWCTGVLAIGLVEASNLQATPGTGTRLCDFKFCKSCVIVLFHTSNTKTINLSRHRRNNSIGFFSCDFSPGRLSSVAALCTHLISAATCSGEVYSLKKSLKNRRRFSQCNCLLRFILVGLRRGELSHHKSKFL